MYAFFHTIAFRGLRRGEGVGQDWTHVNLDAGLLTVASEIVQDGWTPYESEPKTDSSANTIGLDNDTVAVLRAHKVRQNKERLKWGKGWPRGRSSPRKDGTWLHPDTVLKEFRRLYEEIGLPPINLRDLRHGTATLTHAGGGDLHTIKETLRHSTITLTSDTYTSLLPEVDKAAARLVPRARPAVAANGSSSTAAPASLPHGAPNDEAPRSAEANRGAK
ncbi:site-specific integrase [Streptomyces sp. NPDC048424]|uniref:site-specific integrase n=1 Tax=Streptomyces sp. NPDC048424 TaxID=3155265 RepID=UPI003438BB7E